MTTPTLTIHESNMQFGPYAAERCFHVEQSRGYQALQDGVKMVEFFLLREQQFGQVLWAIEAKSSSPRAENSTKLEQFITEICQKFHNALFLLLAARLGRQPSIHAELSQLYQDLDLQHLGLRLALIIHGHQKSWLPPVQDRLRQTLKPLIKTWGLSPQSVLVPGPPHSDDIQRKSRKSAQNLSRHMVQTAPKTALTAQN